MTEGVERLYFAWLASQVIIGDGSLDYTELLNYIHKREFFWIVPNDDNRIADALEVRREYYSMRNRRDQVHESGATVLEVIVALSRRMAFLGGGDAEAWAGTFIEHLGLGEMSGILSSRQKRRIEEILDALIWRTYERNGSGGFFPLQHEQEDQTQVEIWYQMNAYIMEHHLV